MKTFIFSLLASSLCAQEISVCPQREEFDVKTSQETWRYRGIGLSGPVLPVLPEITFGSRHSSYDFNLTSSLLGRYLVAQGSYLHRPDRAKEFYLGLGLTIGVVLFPDILPLSSNGKCLPYINIPLTLGWQKETRFTQIQITPIGRSIYPFSGGGDYEKIADVFTAFIH